MYQVTKHTLEMYKYIKYHKHKHTIQVSTIHDQFNELLLLPHFPFLITGFCCFIVSINPKNTKPLSWTLTLTTIYFEIIKLR